MPIDPIVANSPTPSSGPGAAITPDGAAKPPPPAIQPDRIEKSAGDIARQGSGSSGTFYNADIVHNALGSAHMAAASAAAATVGAAERLGPALGELGSRAASAAGSAARAAAPIAGEALGAAGLVLTTQSPAGHAGEEAPSAAWRQHSNAISDRSPQQTLTTYPGNHVDVGPNHTTHPASVPRTVGDSVHTTPAETTAKPLHTGHAAPDLGGLAKPTGTAIHQPNAADLMTEKTRPVHPGIPANPDPHAAYRPQGPYAEFNKFDALKDHVGSAGEGRDWHHIVGQHEANIAKFGPRAIHNTANIVSVDRSAVHRPLNGLYSEKPEALGGQTRREFAAGQSYEEQQAYDMRQLERLGVTIK